MTKYSALDFSLAGDQFLGQPYSKMDCQEFVEMCLHAIDLAINLAGSNAWYREMTWTGSPEECLEIFGEIPKGAMLYIWADDGGETVRGYTDGLGNASHIGIKTGRGEGAIHSSQSRGCVSESKFSDRTITNGGWNRVGLWDRLDYGEPINSILDGIAEHAEEEGPVNRIVMGPNEETVNLRKGASLSAALIDRIRSGASAEVLETSGDWCRITVEGKTGWMMKKFLVERGGTTEDEGTCSSCMITSGEITVPVLMEQMPAALEFLDSLRAAIAARLGGDPE